MDQVRKEYGDDTLDGLVPPSHSQSSNSLEVEDEYLASAYSPAKPKKSCLFYLATVQAFIIIYRAEVLLGTTLAICIGVAFSSSYHHRHKKVNAFDAAHIGHDYTLVKSKYDLSVGSIDHWCLHGDDNSCRCEDPLEPMSKRSSRKWGDQHTENIKSAQAALMKLLAANDAWNNYEGYEPDLDDMWIEAADDDWIYGEGARFGSDDMGFDPFAEEVDWGDDMDDGYASPVEKPAEDSGAGRKLEDYSLDVVFIGDSLTEQRQGTMMGKPVTDFDGIKEVFDKTFTKDKGGDFNGIALGISGDTSANLLWRLMNGEMPYGLTPKVWWLGIGLNDLSMKGCSEEVVLLGILRVVEEIQNAHPNDVIVINSLLPVQRNADGLLEHLGKHHEDLALKKNEKNLLDEEMSQKRAHVDFWPSIVAINEELSKFASKHKGVKFFNADSVFVDERQDGKYLKMDLMHDPVHPNVSGHKKWNNAIKKRLHEIIKDEE
eukprot:CAMPEP_0172552348 /NCGR_PEP_ID=MMETSP1067-20121228/44384_1 /TAXON_ID=265564 ORGANISM="Thalassiosira punctigera, Strain Tpunct2005C2" /NCGR_SAMPLE_ID=MMETSP1067 /ASSEMBLY_ACC=CAM_ASM_000444 /LENGTH=487 /DNA_ID=CAMNT_0013340311 /DNA_START=115 /DNA_END=1578 /DNA_ORIENTATION=+